MLVKYQDKFKFKEIELNSEQNDKGFFIYSVK
jgi:hypothetical protein